MTFASSVGFSTELRQGVLNNSCANYLGLLGLDFFDSGLRTCTAVARLTLALAKLSCSDTVGAEVDDK